VQKDRSSIWSALEASAAFAVGESTGNHEFPDCPNPPSAYVIINGRQLISPQVFFHLIPRLNASHNARFLMPSVPILQYDIRLPEIPEVRILKSGEARFYSTFVTNNIIFFRVRMVPEVLEAMKRTRGLYNIEGAQDDAV
jgi:hypothetical protein